PIKKSQSVSHGIQPKTTNEVLLLTLLRKAEAANIALKHRVIDLQAASILNEMYCSVLRGQLANQEEKKRRGKEKGKLMGDGLPRFLSGDEFYERVVEFEREQQKVAAEKRTRKEERQRRAEALATWKKLEEGRKSKNKAQRAGYRAALERWTLEKAKAKAEGRKFSEGKPLLGKLLPAIPRPALNAYEEEDGGCSGEEEFDLDEVSDGSDED
ncbi:hypothetical protein BV22DRAFT_996045, partial [Leucogyrophana mollusca]